MGGGEGEGKGRRAPAVDEDLIRARERWAVEGQWAAEGQWVEGGGAGRGRDGQARGGTGDGQVKGAKRRDSGGAGEGPRRAQRESKKMSSSMLLGSLVGWPRQSG